jgi:cyclophilin family peptidyl-prolyl cis-trans isomerase
MTPDKKRRFFRMPLLIAALLMFLLTRLQGATLVDVSTTFGSFELELYGTQTPLTVANFLSYVTNDLYDNTIIHRSVPGFVIQGGGFGLLGNSLPNVPTNAPVENEPGISNLRGSIAMAKVGGDPNSATSQWFINLGDNSSNLDSQNGGFTVFGEVVGSGMSVVDAIAAVPVYDASSYLGSSFSQLPLLNPVLTANNLVMINSMVVVPEPSTYLLFGMGLGAMALVASRRRV